MAIDTATEVMAIALGDTSWGLAERRVDAGRSHLELLLPAIHDLLGEQKLAIDDITAIVAGTGPGTFSGLRIGISTARALAQTLKLPLYGFSTLRALALALASRLPAGDPKLVLPLINARRGQVFAQLYKKEGEDEVTPESDVLCLDPRLVAKKVASITHKPVRTGGNGAVAFHDVFAGGEQLDLLAARDQGNRISAAWHLRAAAAGAGYCPEQLLSVVPVYIREPDADKTVLLRKRKPWLK